MNFQGTGDDDDRDMGKQLFEVGEKIQALFSLIE